MTPFDDALKPKPVKTFAELMLHSAVARVVMRHHVGSPELVAVHLYNQLIATQEECRQLYLIAPRKIRVLDGTVYIYRCPDSLIPEPGPVPDINL